MATVAIVVNSIIQNANFPFDIFIFLIFYMNKKHEILPLKDTELIIKISNIYW